MRLNKDYLRGLLTGLLIPLPYIIIQQTLEIIFSSTIIQGIILVVLVITTTKRLWIFIDKIIGKYVDKLKIKGSIKVFE